MAEPNTTNIALIVPNTGDLPGAWGTSALNPNFSAIDGMFGGVLNLSLGAATTVTLSLPAGSISVGAGPVQSQNALIKFSGTLTGNAVFTLGMPGRYIFHNACTVGTNYVKIASSGAGNACGLPPGQKVTLFHDGTNIDFVDTMPVGAAFDLHGATALPAWMTACTVLPYLIKDGTTYNVATYPALGAILGSTFGGNGVTTFGVPDEMARARFGYDTVGTGRLTPGVSFDGTVMGAAGGNQNYQSHTHVATDSGHAHNYAGVTFPNTGGAGSSNALTSSATRVTDTSFAVITVQSSGTGNSGNVPPGIISHLPLIKT